MKAAGWRHIGAHTVKEEGGEGEKRRPLSAQAHVYSEEARRRPVKEAEAHRKRPGTDRKCRDELTARPQSLHV